MGEQPAAMAAGGKHEKRLFSCSGEEGQHKDERNTQRRSPVSQIDDHERGHDQQSEQRFNVMDGGEGELPG